MGHHVVSPFPEPLIAAATALLQAMEARGLKLTTAESCTGGLISALLTEIPGSSGVFTQGYITYANEAKIVMIGVDAALIAAHGAVSEPVARAMAEGALSAAQADMAVAVTGIAGPGGGTEQKPVGLVHFAVARRAGSTLHAVHQFRGGRSAVRMQAVAAALELILRTLAD